MSVEPTSRSFHTKPAVSERYDWQCPVLVHLFTISDPDSDTLGLQQALRPVQNLVDDSVNSAEHPGSADCRCWGWLLLGAPDVTNLLASAGFDQLGRRFGPWNYRGQTLSGIIGTVSCADFDSSVAIAALNALRIDAISVQSRCCNRSSMPCPHLYGGVDFDCSLLPGAVCVGSSHHILFKRRLRQHLLCARSAITTNEPYPRHQSATN